jgi:hypothetical protein
MFRLIFLIFLLFLTGSFSASAQTNDPELPNQRQRQQEEYPKNIRENLAKQRIERQKKEYEELVKRSEEAVRLSEELERTFATNNRISTEDYKKLEKLEKLVKKIRSDLGGSDEGEGLVDEEENFSSLTGAFKVLQTNAVKLYNELKKSTRYSISVVAIKSSNILLRVVKFIRFRK